MISSSCECFNSPWKPLRNINNFQGQKLFCIGCELCDSMESEGRSGQFLELQSSDAKNFLRFDSHFLSCRLRGRYNDLPFCWRQVINCQLSGDIFVTFTY